MEANRPWCATATQVANTLTASPTQGPPTRPAAHTATIRYVVDYCERDGLAFIPWFPLASGKVATCSWKGLRRITKERRSRLRWRGCCAAILIDTAHLHAYRAADAIDEAALEGQPLSYLERARVRMDSGNERTARRLN